MQTQSSGKNSLILYYDYIEPFNNLSDEELGKLLRAVMLYDRDRIYPELSGAVAMAFAFVKTQLDKDKQKYEEKCEKNRLNAAKGGRPKKETEETEKSERFFSKPKKPDNDNDSDNDNDNDSDNDNDIYNNIIAQNQIQTQSEPKQNEKCACENFEKLWYLYPNKKGKGQVSDAQKIKLLQIPFDEMKRAIDRYISGLKQDEWRKPQNGSTFFNSGYVDYLDDNYQETSNPNQNNSKYNFADLEKSALSKLMRGAP